MTARQNTALLICLLVFGLNSMSAKDNYVTTKAKKGDGISVILNRFHLPISEYYIELFAELNPNSFDKYGGVLLDYRYNLPIIKTPFNKKSLESSLPTEFAANSMAIIEYNQKVESIGFKANYKIDGYIWVPIHMIEVGKEIISTPAASTSIKPKENRQGLIVEPLFGKAFQNVKIVNTSLQGYTFYLVSGHGGPDPGAIGYKNNNELTEDEYGYDITLRLARNLMEYSANVFMIIQDSADGIRDEYYLKNNTNEVHINGDSISLNQKIRLSQRADIVNKESVKFDPDKQYCFIVHVDSRATKKRIDIFFYYQDGNDAGRTMANTIYKTIKRKYDKNQPGRGYTGSVTTRNLYMLRNIVIPAVYIELGNIQNPLDQVRFLDPNNRQAIANWLRDGIVNELK